jgi:hypothetical protein
MRATLLVVLIGGAVFAASADQIPELSKVQSGKWRMLDKNPRARTVASWNTAPVTEAEFRKMQQRYRPQDFNMWAKRLRQLRPGMTEAQVVHVLQPKQIGPTLTSGGNVWTTIILDDAYFSNIFVDPQSKRMISATPPLAMTYEIKADHKSLQRPNQSLEPTAGRCKVQFNFMKQFSEFATLAVASGGSAPSR